MTYPPGWSVITQAEVRRERWPGGKGKGVPLVYPGQEIVPDQPVLRIEREPLEQMKTVPQSPMGQENVGTFYKGQKASAAGGSETIPAGLHGRVVDVTRRGGVVIESRATVLQGKIGTGNQVAGVLTMWYPGNSGVGQAAIPPGAILVVPGPLTFSLLRQAVSSGVTGVIASSITIRDLEGFLRTDLIQLMESENIEQAQDYLPPITLLFTEGLGSMAMPVRIVNLLSQHQGSIALLSGITSVRKGIIPDLIISLPAKEALKNWHPVQPDTALIPGAQVRVCSGELEGTIGVIDYLFTYEQVFAGGVRARALRLRRDDGSALVVPVALVERIG